MPLRLPVEGGRAAVCVVPQSDRVKSFAVHRAHTVAQKTAGVGKSPTESVRKTTAVLVSKRYRCAVAEDGVTQVSVGTRAVAEPAKKRLTPFAPKRAVGARLRVPRRVAVVSAVSVASRVAVRRAVLVRRVLSALVADGDAARRQR